MKTSVWAIRSISKGRGAEKWDEEFTKVWLPNPPYPLDIDPMTQIKVSIVCTERLVCTWYVAMFLSPGGPYMHGNICYANHFHMQTMKTPIWTTGSRSKGHEEDPDPVVQILVAMFLFPELERSRNEEQHLWRIFTLNCSRNQNVPVSERGTWNEERGHVPRFRLLWSRLEFL